MLENPPKSNHLGDLAERKQNFTNLTGYIQNKDIYIKNFVQRMFKEF